MMTNDDIKEVATPQELYHNEAFRLQQEHLMKQMRKAGEYPVKAIYDINTGECIICGLRKHDCHGVHSFDEAVAKGVEISDGGTDAQA